MATIESQKRTKKCKACNLGRRQMSHSRHRCGIGWFNNISGCPCRECLVKMICTEQCTTRIKFVNDAVN